MDLFGRETQEELEQLRERFEERTRELEELRDEHEQLQERFEQNKERLTEARRDKQEAEAEVNRLEDRIEALEDRTRDDTPDTADAGTTRSVGRERSLHLLNVLDGIDHPSASAETSIDAEEARFTDPWLISVAFQAPLPLEPEERTASRFHVDPVVEQLRDRYLFIHVTAGGSGIAVIEDGAVLRSRCIDADIKAEHTKGGYSQKRFERIREQQVQEHIGAVAPELEAFSDAAYATALLAGPQEMRKRFIDETDLDVITVSSEVGQVRDEDDLERSFDSAMGCTIRQVPR